MIVANRRNSVEEWYLPIAVQSFESHKLDSLKLYTYTAKEFTNLKYLFFLIRPHSFFASLALFVIPRIVSTLIFIDLYTISKKGAKKKRGEEESVQTAKDVECPKTVHSFELFARHTNLQWSKSSSSLTILLLLQHVSTFLSLSLCRFFSQATIFHFKISHYSRIVFSQMLLYPNACEICCK